MSTLDLAVMFPGEAINLSPPAAADAIDTLTQAIAPATLPDEWLQFLRTADGASAESFTLYAAQEIPLQTAGYKIWDAVPGAILLGTDGGGFGFAVVRGSKKTVYFQCDLAAPADATQHQYLGADATTFITLLIQSGTAGKMPKFPAPHMARPSKPKTQKKPKSGEDASNSPKVIYQTKGEVYSASWQHDGTQVIVASRDEAGMLPIETGTWKTGTAAYPPPPATFEVPPEPRAIATASDGSFDPAKASQAAAAWRTSPTERSDTPYGWRTASRDATKVAVIHAPAHHAYSGVWDVRDGRLLATLPAQQPPFHAVFAGDGTLLAIAAANTLRIYTTDGGSLIKEIPIQNVYWMRATPSGKVVIIGDQITVHDPATGQTLAQWPATGGPMNAAYAAEDQRLLIVYASGRLRLADLMTGKDLAETSAPAKLVETPALSPDGRHLLMTGYRAKKVLVWTLP